MASTRRAGLGTGWGPRRRCSDREACKWCMVYDATVLALSRPLSDLLAFNRLVFCVIQLTAGLISSTHRAPVARLQYIVPPCTPFTSTFTARASCTQLGSLQQQLHSSVLPPVTISPLFLDFSPVLTSIAHVVGTHNTIQVFAIPHHLPQ